MRSFHPRDMHRPSLLLFLTALAAAGCGAAGSAHKGHATGGGPVGTAQPTDELLPAAGEPSFMRVGPFEPAATSLAEKKTEVSKEKQQSLAPIPSPTATTPREAEGEPLGSSRPRDKNQNVQAAVVDSTQGISEADVRAAIAKSGSSFRRCYDLGLKAAADFAGSVTLRVAISPTGSVASADVVTSSTNNQSVDLCVRDEVRKLVFKTTGSGAVVAFPIEFVR